MDFVTDLHNRVVHADFPLSIFVEEEGTIKLLPPWEIVFQYEKHYDIYTEQMVKGRIESVVINLPLQIFKDTKEDDDIPAELVPSKVLLPIVFLNTKENLYESVLSVVLISLEGACRRGCGLSHTDIPKKRDTFGFSLSCIKHDPSERKLKAPECLDFCMASGCIERAPVSKHLYPMQHREWLLGHDCEVEGTEYQQPTLRDLSSEMQEHNEKEQASPDKAQALKRPDSGGKRVQRKARRVASQLAKGRRIEPLPDTPETQRPVRR